MLPTEYGKECVHVELREGWHYNAIVYEEQIQNLVLDKNQVVNDIKCTAHYNKILSESIFSLCPEGAGPNTLRLWESIAVGSIPVIFSDDVSIIQESNFGKELLDCIVHWRKPIDKCLFNYLDSINDTELERMRLKLINLYPYFEQYSIFDNTGMTPVYGDLKSIPNQIYKHKKLPS